MQLGHILNEVGADAMEEIHDVFKAAGAKMVGYWPTEGYQHTESKVNSPSTFLYPWDFPSLVSTGGKNRLQPFNHVVVCLTAHLTYLLIRIGMLMKPATAAPHSCLPCPQT